MLLLTVSLLDNAKVLPLDIISIRITKKITLEYGLNFKLIFDLILTSFTEVSVSCASVFRQKLLAAFNASLRFGYDIEDF